MLQVYSIVITVLILILWNENRIKSRWLRGSDETIKTQAARIQHLERIGMPDFIKVQAYNPSSGDVLIATCDSRLTPQQIINIRDGFKKALPDQKLIITDGIKMSWISGMNPENGMHVSEVIYGQKS